MSELNLMTTSPEGGELHRDAKHQGEDQPGSGEEEEAEDICHQNNIAGDLTSEGHCLQKHLNCCSKR